MPGDAMRQQPAAPGNFKDSYHDAWLDCIENAEGVLDQLNKMNVKSPDVNAFGALKDLNKALEAFEKATKERTN